MKKIFAVTIKDGSEGSDVCALMAGKTVRTAFPGCWEITEALPEVIDRIANVVNEFSRQPDFDCVVFGCSELAADAIIAKLESTDVKKLTAKQLAEWVGLI